MRIIVVLYILHAFHYSGIRISGLTILDIYSPDPSSFESIECHVDSIPTRLYMPKDYHAIRRVKGGEKEFWEGDKCSLVIIHFSGNKVRFIRLIVEENGILDILYEMTCRGWKKVASNTRMTAMKEIQYTSHGVIVDINFPPIGIKEITANWDGLDVRILIPKRLHYASEVCLSSEHIWKSGENCEKCILIIAYLEHAFPIAVHLLVRERFDIMNGIYFVRDGIFKASNYKEFFDRITVIRKAGCKSIKWSTCV